MDATSKKLETGGTAATLRITRPFFVGYVNSEVKLSRVADLVGSAWNIRRVGDVKV